MNSSSFSVSETISVTANAFEIITGDWNDNGDLDLAVALGNNTTAILTNDGSGSFSVNSSISFFGSDEFLVAGDWNGDGSLDLVAPEITTGSAEIVFYKNN